MALLSVNPNKVHKAYRKMDAIGLVKTVKNNQSTITKYKKLINNIRKALIGEAKKFL